MWLLRRQAHQRRSATPTELLRARSRAPTIAESLFDDSDDHASRISFNTKGKYARCYNSSIPTLRDLRWIPKQPEWYTPRKAFGGLHASLRRRSMLTLAGKSFSKSEFCDRVSRRNFLKIGALGL